VVDLETCSVGALSQRPRVVGGGDGQRMWRVATGIRNKQSRTVDKGWPLNLGVQQGFTTSDRKKN
jgi:hypothetical protein